MFLRQGEQFVYAKRRAVFRPDVMLCCMHGKNGEDGQFAAICDASSLPYTCCGVDSSALGMNKWFSKLACLGLKIPVVKGCVIREEDIEELLNIGKKTVFIWEENAGEISVCFLHISASKTACPWGARA